jgi:hypothetical protein
MKLEVFNENSKDIHKKGLWKAVKNLNGKFTPRYIQMRDRKGMLVSLTKRAEAIADYLEKEHWYNPQKEGESRLINSEKICEQENMEEQRQPFTEEELEDAIKLTKKGKEPGPDTIRMELIKWMDPQNKQALLATINEWWEKWKLQRSSITLESPRKGRH